MNTRTVTTQTELDTALESDVSTIYIKSEFGVWLTLRSNNGKRVVALGSSSVEAWGSSSVEAWDSSSVEAWDSSSVVALGSSSVEAWDSSSVVAWDSSSVEAWDSSSVEAWDSSSVEAWGSSSVEAWGSSSVVAWDSSSVEAGSYVAIHLHSAQATIEGGVVIDVTKLDLNDPATWADYHGTKVTDGKAIVYKAVDAEGYAGHRYTRTRYEVGQTVTAPDWDSTQFCGHGLHFGVSPTHARTYYSGEGEPRYLACEVDASFVPLGDKLKAPSCRVLHEVDRHGRAVSA